MYIKWLASSAEMVPVLTLKHDREVNGFLPIFSCNFQRRCNITIPESRITLIS